MREKSKAERAAMGAAGATLITEHYRVEDLGRRFVRLIREVIDRDADGVAATG